jgi:hypothetical protein
MLKRKNKVRVKNYSKWINLFDTEVEEYGRNLSKTNLKWLKNNYDDTYLTQLIVVDIRVEKLGFDYALVDGQHRKELIIFKNVNASEIMVQAMVIPYETYQDRALRYTNLNTKRKNLTWVDAFKGRVHAEEEKALEVMKVLNNWDIDLVGVSDGGKYKMTSGSIAEKLGGWNVGKKEHNKLKYNPLEWNINIIFNAWESEEEREKALHNRMLSGLHKFRRTYKLFIDPDYLSGKLGMEDVGEMISRIDYWRKNGDVSRPIFEVYNKGLRGSKKLTLVC